MFSLSDLKLCPMAQTDLGIVLRWRNSDAVRRFMLNDHIITHEEHADWYQSISNDASCEWHIAEFWSNPVGVVYITDIRPQDGTCTWGMYLGDNMQNSGIGVLMGIHAIDRMVKHHKIRKIWGETLESNARLVLMHKRFGFEEEGVLRKHVRRGGTYEDVIITALLTSRWQEIRSEIVSTLRLENA